jgi:hypothetical protein
MRGVQEDLRDFNKLIAAALAIRVAALLANGYQVAVGWEA